MNEKYKKIYDAMPIMAQNFILTLYSLKLDKQRYGGKFQEYRKFLEKSQYYTHDALLEYQNLQLRSIVKHAYTTVPYYHELFKKIGLGVNDVSSVEDLQKIPVLTRKDIIQNFANLRSRSYSPDTLLIGHTSGTTGSPLEVYYDSNMLAMTYAALDRQYRWADINMGKFGDRVAVLRGNIIVPIDQNNPPFWRYNYLHRQLFLSSFHLSSDNLPHYIEEINNFKPLVLDGYPSTLYVLAKYLKNQGEKLKLKAALTSSETLYDFQREVIEESFQCRVFDYYGAAERVIFATECNHHKGHHINSEFGITEFLNADGAAVAAGESGYITGTSLHNYGMPLLRYKSTDITSLKKHICSCGRVLPLMEDVATKAEDSLTLKDGRIISPSVLTHPFKPMHSVDASQIVQEDLDNIIIRIVPNQQYTEHDTLYLIEEFKKRLGSETNVQVEFIDTIDRTGAGKFKWVISKVSMRI